MHRVIIGLIAGALSLAACGSGRSSTPAAIATTTPLATTPAAPTTIAPSTTTSAAPSARQVASAIAATVLQYREAVDAESACSSFDCLTLDNEIPRWKKLVAFADTISQKLTVSAPAELAQLVTETRQAANTLDTAWAGWMTCLDKARKAGGSRQDCSAEEAATEKAWRDYGSVLDGWRPFGV